jgi:hypothetical protein
MKCLSSEVTPQPLPSHHSAHTHENPSSDGNKSSSNSTSLDLSEVEKQTKRLRVTLNKVSHQNLAKLSQTLSEIGRDSYLLQRLVDLIFDRVALQSALAELYSHLVQALTQDFETKWPGSSKFLLGMLRETAEKRLSSPVQKGLTGVAKFVTQLFVCELLSPPHMLLVYDALLKEHIFSEEQVEAFCHLFVSTYKAVHETYPKEANDRSKLLVKLHQDPRLSKRLQYMVLEVIEETRPLASHIVGKPPVHLDIPAHINRPRKIKFLDEQPLEVQQLQVIDSPQLPILKARVSPEVKALIQHAVKLSGRSVALSADAITALFISYFPPQRELVYQIFKYAISEFDTNALLHVVEVFEVLTQLTPSFLTCEMLETGVWRTVESLDDIQLDCPKARELMEFTLRLLKERGLLQNLELLLEFLGRERFTSQGNEEAQ